MKRLLKIPLAGFSLVLFLIALLLYLYFFTSVPEQQLNDWLGYYVPEKIGYRITVERISRDIWKRIKLEGIEISKVKGDEFIPVGNINSLEAHYSIRDIIFRDYHFSDLVIDGGEFSLLSSELFKRDTLSQPESQTSGEIDFPNIAIDHIVFKGIDVTTKFGSDTLDIEMPVLEGSFGNDGVIVDVSVDSLSVRCPQRDFKIVNMAGKFFRAEGDWMIESFAMQTGRSNIGLSGRFGKLTEPNYQLSFDLSPFDFGDINSFTGLDLLGGFDIKGNMGGDLKEFRGQASGSGSIYDRPLDDFTTEYHFDSGILYLDKYDGRAFKAPLDGNGYVDFVSNPQKYGFEGRVKELNLRNIAPDLYSSFSGNIDVNGEGFSEDTFHMAIDMDLTRADIDIYHFDGARGQVDFDLNGISFLPGFVATYKHTTTTFNGYLDYVGDMDLSGKAKFGDLADFENQIFITDLDGVGEANFHATGPTLDFTINGSFQSDSCRLYGLNTDSLYFNLQLKSFITHKVGRVVGGWQGGNLYSVPVDSGYFSVVVSGEKFFLDDIHLRNANNQAMVRGIFDNGTIPPSLVIDTAVVVLWQDTVYNVSPLVIDLYEKEMEFQVFKLYSRSSTLEMAGVVTYDGEMGLEIKADSLQIKPVAAYFVKDRTLTGVMSGEIYVAGDFDSPQFGADFRISGLTIDDVPLGQFNVRADYADLKLDITSAKLTSPSTVYSLTGSLPINLSFTSTDAILPDNPIDLKLVASGTSVALAPVFVQSVRRFDGNFDIDIALTGTYGKPQVSGTFSLDSGTVYVMELVEPLRDVKIGGRMVNDNIYIDTLVAYARLKENSFTKTMREYLRTSPVDEQSRGRISGSGTIKVLGLNLFDYNLAMTGYGCEFYVDGYDVHFLTDLYLKVEGSSPPLVSGWAKLKRFELRDRFSKFISSESPEAAVIEDSTLWNIKLEVSAANNLWIKNAESILETEGAADMEMKGDVTVTREGGVYNILGELDVIRGYFYLANLKFRLLSGTMVFDQPDTLDPMVNFDVTTKILTPGPQASYTDLNLAITGRLSNLQIGAAEGSPISDEDVLMTLAENMVATGQTNISENLALIGQQLAYSLGNINLVDMVDISREEYVDTTGGPQKVGTRFTVAKYISPKLFLTYSQRISQENAGRSVGFEYILNNNLSVEGRQGTGNEGVSFDVSLHFEF